VVEFRSLFFDIVEFGKPKSEEHKKKIAEAIKRKYSNKD